MIWRRKSVRVLREFGLLDISLYVFVNQKVWTAKLEDNERHPSAYSLYLWIFNESSVYLALKNNGIEKEVSAWSRLVRFILNHHGSAYHEWKDTAEHGGLRRSRAYISHSSYNSFKIAIRSVRSNTHIHPLLAQNTLGLGRVLERASTPSNS